MKIDYQAIRERYSPKPAPKCHICGAEMTVQRMSASCITYGCTGATYDDNGCHYAEGRSFVDNHYEQSSVTVVDVSDPDVLVVLDELEAAQKLFAEATLKLIKQHALLNKAEIHIKEIEARTVSLPDVEKWRSVDAVRAQNAYKVLVSKVLADIGIAIKEA
ncbi:ead/Ea22-like family protein [Citrobacter cronae]|uniref:ead/Ea22-like family protein n=1 Tax=Citrobacter cronae TaxID=1748967 RepID=UPI0018680FA5|nr:ead/Ea22-like family protein [Citrobacter cronae]